MAKFVYSLQSVLDLKLKMETQAKMEFAEKMGILNEENTKMEGLINKKASCEEEHKKSLEGKLCIRDIEEASNSVRIVEEQILTQKERIQKAQQEVNKANEKLVEVMRDRKAYETLREKAFENFMSEENRNESKMVDELTSYSYSKKRQVDN